MAGPSNASVSNDGNRGPLVVVVLLIANIITVVFLCSRLLVRVRLRIGLGQDDLMIVLGWILAVCVVIVNFISIYQDGVGKHIIHVTPAQEILVNRWSLTSEVLVVFSNMFVKFSIGLFLLRIFTTRKKRIWIVYSIQGFIAVTSISAAVALLCQCQPIGKMFNPTIPGKCYSPQVRLGMAYYQGASSVLCDTMLAILPTVFLWDVQIKLKIKVGICCLLGLGLLAAACAIVRIRLLSDPSAVDFTYWVADVYIWADLELTVAIIASCTPTLRPLWTVIVDRYRLYYSRKRSGYTIHMDGRHEPEPISHPAKRFPHPFEVGHPSHTVLKSVASADPSSYSNATMGDNSCQDLNAIRKTTEMRSETFDEVQVQMHGHQTGSLDRVHLV